MCHAPFMGDCKPLSVRLADVVLASPKRVAGSHRNSKLFDKTEK